MMNYSNPKRENEPTALPDVEVFYMSNSDIIRAGKDTCWYNEESEPLERGWYYWACFPGCLPDSDPTGPFDTAESAKEDYIENNQE